MRLNEDERRFVAYLAERGGSAYLYEVRRALSMPHTSAWRIARRLQEMEVIESVKVRIGRRELLRIFLKRRLNPVKR